MKNKYNLTLSEATSSEFNGDFIAAENQMIENVDNQLFKIGNGKSKLKDLNNIGDNQNKKFYSVVPDGIPLWLSRKGQACGGSNTAINDYSTLAHFGGAEWGVNLKYGIGFGYRNPVKDNTKYSPVWIGVDQVNTDTYTASDFVVATRNVSTDTAPVINLRVTTSGQIKANTDYKPNDKEDLVTKEYADGLLLFPDPPAKGSYTLQSVDGVVSWIAK